MNRLGTETCSQSARTWLLRCGIALAHSWCRPSVFRKISALAPHLRAAEGARGDVLRTNVRAGTHMSRPLILHPPCRKRRADGDGQAPAKCLSEVASMPAIASPACRFMCFGAKIGLISRCSLTFMCADLKQGSDGARAAYPKKDFASRKPGAKAPFKKHGHAGHKDAAPSKPSIAHDHHEQKARGRLRRARGS